MELTHEQRDEIIQAITQEAMIAIGSGWLFELVECVIPQGLEGWPDELVVDEAQRGGIDLEEILEDEEEK